MNILYFTGNGFDINLGMPTKYADFYKHYKEISSTNKNIQILKNDIEDDYKNWSDLELAIGKYTDRLNSIEDFDSIFDDILDNLGDYLQQIEEMFDFSSFQKEKLYNYLCNPEDNLPKADSDIIKAYKKEWEYSIWNIDIVTFNYTRSIEKILGDKTKNLKIGKHDLGYDITLREISHLHGFCDERMVMGVNDTSQLSNSSFYKIQDVIETIVKSNCNKVQKHTVDDQCKAQINLANLICIFGSSIGDTDNCWWELIGEQLKRDNFKLIIFTRGEEVISKRKGYKKARIERKMKDYFLNKTKLSDEEKINLEDRVYVGVDTDMFSILKHDN